MGFWPKTDFWKVGVLPASATSLLDAAAVAERRDKVIWAPEPGPWRYLADPFGVVRNGSIHMFVEAFDYRTKRGVIEHHELTADRIWQGGEVVLKQPFHLSYPFVIEHDGEVFMVPESYQAGEVALYRARQFPGGWEQEAVLLTDTPAAESSFIRHDGFWWMFFTIVGPRGRAKRELHLAHSVALTGPWMLHPLNPVLTDTTGARPGGAPILGPDGCVILPVQDCSRTYGGAVRFLKFKTLSKTSVGLEHLPAVLTGELVSDTHTDGLHTFSSCGASTLIDVKRIDRSCGRGMIDVKRRLKRLAS